MAEVVLDNISKSFGKIDALKGLSLTIADGEFIVLLGPTGAGKTTTLRLIAGLETADQGRVLINGEDMTRAAPVERDITFIFQQYSLYPHYTVFENIAFPLKAPGRNLSAAQIETKVVEVAKMLRIEEKLNNKATQLSGGEMQRVSIGRALVRSPNIFLMDEPLSSLDAKLREELRIELKRIQIDMGATILYVTHDQLEAMTLANRIGILQDGELVQIGAPRQIYERPVNIYTAKRLGSPQINLVRPDTLGPMKAPAGTHQIGLRPEDIVLTDTGREGIVDHVEFLGVETIVSVRIEDYLLHSLVPTGSHFAKGEPVNMSWKKGKEVFFDSSEQRIDANG